MKSIKKGLLTLGCAALLVSASVMGTMAYLTSSDTVTNTFTVGKVAITLDEAKVGADGKALTGDNAARVKENSYKLMPGHTYDKDPTVTVKAGSEPSYIKMTVTVSNASNLDKLFKDKQISLNSVVGGYDDANWSLESNTEDKEANTRTYTFYYKEIVSAGNTDVVLDDLFETVEVPGALANADMDTIGDVTLTVNAYAIQADGFATADDAWAAFGA